MSKHTPGRWLATVIGKGLRASPIRWRIHTEEGVPVADVFEHPDACLIAKAPEMKQKLQDFVDSWGEEVQNDLDINGADAVEWIVGFWHEVNALLTQIES